MLDMVMDGARVNSDAQSVGHAEVTEATGARAAPLSARHRAALTYAASGIPVFPCHPPGARGAMDDGKKPATIHGHQDATTDPTQIDAWWSECDYNVAIFCEPAGLGIVDLDGKLGIEQWHTLYPDAEPTYTVRTPRGGEHWYYEGKLEPSQHKLASNIDTRGRGSYVLVPPSRTVDGVYTTIDDGEMEPLPSWLPTKLAEMRVASPRTDAPDIDLDLPVNVARAQSWLEAHPPRQEGNGSDEHTYEMACNLHNLGVSIVQCTEMLCQWAPHHDEWWIEGKVKHAYSYAQNAPGVDAIEAKDWSQHPAVVKLAQEATDDDIPDDDDEDDDVPSTPDMSILSNRRIKPPVFPLDVLGPEWSDWVKGAARSASVPPDFVVAPLLSCASALIGNARWAEATPGWKEPPHLWCCSVGNSGDGKSPGADTLFQRVIPRIERAMQIGFDKTLGEWRIRKTEYDLAIKHLEAKIKQRVDVEEYNAVSSRLDAIPVADPGREPEKPLLKVSDVTVERVAELLTDTAPKGLVIVRDELIGWITGMNNYNDAGRPFWIEAYGGRPYTVQRKNKSGCIDVPHLAVSVNGGTQPDKIRELLRTGDDGLLARICWFYPEAIAFQLGTQTPKEEWAIHALNHLRQLEMRDTPPDYLPVKMAHPELLQDFGQGVQEQQEGASGLMVSALGKARGLALRLSLVLEYLWWAGAGGTAPEPTRISPAATKAAIRLVRDFLMPMAECVYGIAGRSIAERNATTVAKFIKNSFANEVHPRTIQRMRPRLKGITDKTTAEDIREACDVLVKLGWLIPPPTSGKKIEGQKQGVYVVNLLVHETRE